MTSIHPGRLDASVFLGATASDADLKVLLARFLAEAKDRRVRGSSESVDFFVSASRSLGKMKGTAHSSLRLACAWECGVFFETFGYFSHALDSARQLEILSRSLSDKSWLRKSYTMAGIVHGEIGNVVEAMVHHEKALALAKTEDIEYQIPVLVNIGVVLNYGGLHREAIPCFRKAAELAASDAKLRHYYYMALANIAQSFLFLQEFQQGYEVCLQALSERGEPDDIRMARSRAIREWTLVQLALELGKYDEARQHSIACRMYSLWGHNQRSARLADLTDALCEVYAGNASKGVQALEMLLSRARQGAEREDVLRALVKAYDEVRRPEQALACLSELLTQTRLTGETQILNALTGDSMAVEFSSASVPGLRPLVHMEAKLRAKVAENETTSSRLEMLERLAVTADLKEDASGEHGYRVGKLASLIAGRLGWSPDSCNAIEHAARLHDIGKVGVPDRILLTSQSLKDAERHLMCAHTQIGKELLSKSNIPQIRLAEEIAHYHHEWWNGGGYPAKLAETRIPVHARIVAVADVFDALTHGRPYSEPWSIHRALDEIRARSAIQFDPQIVEVFLTLIIELQKEHHDLDEYLGRAARASEFAQARGRIRAMLGPGVKSEIPS